MRDRPSPPPKPPAYSSAHRRAARLAKAAASGAVLLLLAAALLAAPATEATVGPWQENEQSKVRLISPWQVAPAEGTLILGLEFETIPGWHVYWKNSGDAGYPPAVDFSPTPEVTGSEILWPAPERYHLPGDLVALGYEGHVVYPLRVMLDREAPAAGAESLLITAALDYLVCEVDCIPYSYELSLGQPLAGTSASGQTAEPVEDAETAELLATWRARVPRPAEEVEGLTTDGYVDLSDPDAPRLTLRFAGLTPAVGYDPELFLEASDVFEAGVPERLDAGPVVDVEAEAEAGGDATAAVPEMRFAVPLTFRQRPEEMPTDADFAWTLTGVVTPAGHAVPVEARRRVPAGTTPPAAGEPAVQRAPARAPALPATLLWAFLGGLLLHLTPTVLPVSLLRLATGSAEPRPLPGALATSAGVAAGAAGLVAWALAGGPATTWGSQLQAPLPVAGLALLATLAALHLWGLLHLPLATAAPTAAEHEEAVAAAGAGTRAAAPTRSDTAGSGLAAAFATGLAVFALALAWDLPPLARSLGPALAGGSGTIGVAIAVAAAVALAAGLALPFLLVAALPALRRLLAPIATDATLRRRVAEALGFLEAGAVLWLLYLLSRQVTGEGLAYVQLALLAVAMVAWLRHSARRRTVAAVLAAVLLALSAAVLWLAVDQRLDTAGGDTGREPALQPPAVTAPGAVDGTSSKPETRAS